MKESTDLGLVCLLAFSLMPLLAEPDPVSRRSVPDTGTIVLTDFSGARDWGPELIHFSLDTRRFKPGKLALLDADGKAVPFQIEDGELAFVAVLKKGSSKTWQLQHSDQDRSGENSSLKISRTTDGIEAGNEFFALRMPKAMSKAFPEPATAAEVPAPLRQWQQNGQDWIGGARLVSQRKVKSYVHSVVRNGPACFEFEARYRFVPKGEYVIRIQISTGVPLAEVTEEYDFGEITDGRDFLMLDLHAGWNPQYIGLIGQQSEARSIPPFTSNPISKYLDGKRKPAASTPPVGGTGNAPSPVVPEAGYVLLEKCVPAGKWGGYRGGIQLWDGDAKNPSAGRRITLGLLSAGSWRKTNSVNLWYREGVGISVALPISVRRIQWSLDIADDVSPFSTHEHDEGLSQSYGRRVWGLYFGDLAAAAVQAHHGYIGLDRCKDWIIDVPEAVDENGSQKFTYPRAMFSRAHVDRIKKAIHLHPDGWYLKSWYLFSGKTEDAIRHAKDVIKQLRTQHFVRRIYLTGLSHYRQSQFLAHSLRAEDALACPDLPADLRTKLRRWLAIYANVMSEPDFNPRGAGVHLGNNNMTINRTVALAYFASLLPDHPRYAYWMDRLHRYVRFKLASQTSPCGSWVACPTYQLYSPTRALNVAQNALRNTGTADLSESGYMKATLAYLGDLTATDPRFSNARVIPGMGNSANQVESIFGVCMAAVADADPEFAGQLRYLHRLAKGRIVKPRKFKGKFFNTTDEPAYAAFYLPDIPEKPWPFATVFRPAYGVVFRAHAGTADETTMLFRAGMNWSHWDTDALNLILYSKGAPLSPGTGYQYYGGPAKQKNGLYHNQVKVGRRDLQEVFGRVDGAIIDYGFGKRADYAVAERYYPPQLFKGGRGEMRWRRHVMFLKSNQPDGANYFVIRETFPGGEARNKWWNWVNLETADLISVDGRAFEKTALNRVVPESQMPSKNGKTIEMNTAFGASSWFWFDRKINSRIRLTFDCNRQDQLGGKETKTIIEVPAGQGQDFFYVLFPRTGNEPLPTCEKLGDGCLKIKTAESTDYVFISDNPLQFQKDGITFSGKAGAVRVSRDDIAFFMNSGSGRIGHGHEEYILEGHGPFEQAIPIRASIETGIHKVGGTEKKMQSVDIGKGITVRGEGPFQAALDHETIRIKTSGRKRVLFVTQPKFIIRPQLFIDDQEWMASWTDYPASGWGTYKNTALIGLSVPKGEHGLVVRNLKFPDGWRRQFDPTIIGVQK